MGKWLTRGEIEAVLAHRALTVPAFASKGPNVLFDLPTPK